MDIDIRTETKQCFPLKFHLFDKLNILHCSATDILVLWNKYQVLLIRNWNFHNPLILISEFITTRTIIINNYLVCLDDSGNIHTLSLKFKNSTGNQLQINFKPRMQLVISFFQNKDNLVCLQYTDDGYILCVCKVQTELIKIYEVKINFITNNIIPKFLDVKEKIIFTNLTVTDVEVKYLQDIFKTCESKSNEDPSLIIISFDRKIVYGCIFKKSMETIFMYMLYACPSEAADIQICSIKERLNIIIGLRSGTFIKLNLSDTSLKPQIKHMNASIYKYITLQNSIVHTDACTLWKLENPFSENEVTKQFIVKQIKDFIRIGDRLVCVTFSNIVYLLPMDSNDSYTNESVEHFCPINTVANNAEILIKDILSEIKENENVLNELKIEENLTAAIALAHRHDLMQKVILHKVIIYNRYEEVLDENKKIMLTNPLKDYFELNTYLILINLELSIEYQHKINEIFSFIDNLKMHFTLINESNTTTTSVTIKKIIGESILLPCKYNKSEIMLNIKLIASIPAPFDKNQTIWTILYKKDIKLNSEHFINTKQIMESNVTSLKREDKKIDTQIIDLAKVHHGSLYNFERNLKENFKEFTFHMRLPKNYEKILIDASNYEKSFNKSKTDYLLKKLGSNEFLKMSNCVYFHVDDVKTKVVITKNDEGHSLLLSSTNLVVLLHFRCYFSRLLYNENIIKNFHLPQGEYTILENLKRRLQICLADSPINEDTILDIAEQFHTNIMGALPL